MQSGLTSSRGFVLVRNCGHRLVCISWEILPCSTGLSVLSGDVLCLAESTKYLIHVVLSYALQYDGSRHRAVNINVPLLERHA
jgi:hypothetical protein